MKKQYRRINKRVARRLYNDGKTIRLVARNCYPNGWSGVGVADITIHDPDNPTEFDATVAHFTYYNCNSELGYYPNYYLEV